LNVDPSARELSDQFLKHDVIGSDGTDEMQTGPSFDQLRSGW
jgi:hypothetical protein